jgi:outer membrane protein, multidrug efflux system
MIVRAITIAFLTICLVGCSGLSQKDMRLDPVNVEAIVPETQPVWTYDFGDDSFRALLARGDLGNLDIKTGLVRARLADATVREAQASGVPSLGFAAGASGTIPLAGEKRKSFDWSLPGNLTLDFSGRLTAAIAAADADAKAAGLDVEIARITFAAELARNYVALAASHDQLKRLDRRLSLERAALTIIKQRQTAGLVSATDSLTRQQTIAGLSQEITAAKANRKLLLSRMAILVGTSKPLDIKPTRGLTDLKPRTFPAHLHTDLVLRRLDVLAAEQRLKAADARRLEAVRAAMPRVTLSLGLGAVSETLSGLFSARNITLSPALRLEGSLFDGGLSKARITQSQNTAALLAIAYAQSRLQAETALLDIAVRKTSVIEQTKQAKSALGLAQKVFGLSQQRFKACKEARMEALEAQRGLADAEEKRAALRQEMLSLSVDFESFVLVGGGSSGSDAPR